MLEHARLRQHIGGQQSERLAVGVRPLAGDLRRSTDEFHVQKLPAGGTKAFANSRGETGIVGLVDHETKLAINVAPRRQFDGGVGLANGTGIGRRDQQDLNRGGPHSLDPRRHTSASVEHDEVGVIVQGSQLGNESAERSNVHVGNLLAETRTSNKLQALRDGFENFNGRTRPVEDFADARMGGDFE